MSKVNNIGMFLNPSTYLIAQGTKLALEKIQSISNEKNKEHNLVIQELNKEAERQEIIARVTKMQAKVQQELAIAQRINTAQEVEIEEFYDTTKKAGANIKVDKNVFTGGLNGEGVNVTRRVYRFTGWHDGADEVFEQSINEDDRAF